MIQIGDTTLLFKSDPQPDSPDRAVCVAFVEPSVGRVETDNWHWRAANGMYGWTRYKEQAISTARMATEQREQPTAPCPDCGKPLNYKRGDGGETTIGHLCGQ
jgi:hypothetical protein